MGEIVDLEAGALVLLAIALSAWAAAWSVAGRLRSGRFRFAAHLAVAVLASTGLVLASRPAFLTFVLSVPGSDYLWLSTLGAIVGWALWRHLALAAGPPGRCAALAVVAIAAACVGWYALLAYHHDRDDLTYMAYVSASRAAPRLVSGSRTKDFLRDAQRLERELETLRTK